MGTVSLNLFPIISSRQRLNINRVFAERLLKNKTSTNKFFCIDQISKNFSSDLRRLSSANNRKDSGIVLEKDSESLTNGQLSSKMPEGLGIIDFFGGKNLLITGATGFLAKVLVEKILRTIPEVNKMYLLIKAKDKEAGMERLMNEIVNTELFECLREKHGTFFEKFILSKLVPVVGNMCETNLGIEEDVANCIAREVDVIINSAATTTFDERFDVALDLNTVGAARILNFAKKCEKLNVYVHVSTAYVSRQSEGKIIGQSFGKGHYVASTSDIFEEPHKHVRGLDIKAEIKLASEMKKSLKENEIDQKLKDLGMSRAQEYGWPNTYAFTKAMGEMVVEDTKGHLPVIIIRPSIIESTLKEPFPGWMEGNRMMDPIMLLYGKGKLPCFYSNPNTALDVIPVDIVVNSTLAAIAKHGRKESIPEDSNSSDDHVYQITSSVANPLICRDLSDMAYQYFSLFPCFDRMGNPIHVSAFKFVTSLEDFLSDMKNTNGNEKHSPRKELIKRKSMEHFKYFAELYQPYTFFNGRFDNNGIEKLMKCFSREEIKEFGLDVLDLMLGFTDEDKQKTGVAQQGAGKGVVRGVLGLPGRLVGGIMGESSAQGSGGHHLVPMLNHLWLIDLHSENILCNLPQAELRLLCSLLANKGLSDNAYALVAEVLKKLVAIVPVYCHLFISELAGMDRPSLMSQVCAVSTDLHCNLVNAEI
ncbi:Fatty acyl-CoA reductase [Heracleum sosnowskyi]|uniref:Fatty acyl-CoA reductase n=1 Tax=Heracleum sosnowskyi TaxID=360622 RepID=A0AAD8HHL6_9APIA|nr:Fatty acyl-CoA reductase [Heracleum sosnowskyi]